ncbi:Gfo/Idh/MocA family oxidoreductase [Microbacterium ulmi]|uniref:Gfo/Idh/MocA family oxidoreductase n=1 Tax=Microbacterium ulmi TaxID=179095 RepID=A0A7Y2M1Z9_9MICO|nr:Gfo/Idh/MocA family oxidoreductase [Microbacterium ulmi]NII68596.1 putative dehydrogenase [Microbacterium ulmi]NNH05031.1 Gfo/Idh/MocA family oxidoreductase [Microbacterium ulmi]
MTARFALVGTGFRAHAFARVAAALPDRLRLEGVFAPRTASAGAAFAAEWGVTAWSSLDGLAASRPDFAVVSVHASATPALLAALAERGIPVLTETPLAPHDEAIDAARALERAGARIQVAEQYHLEPLIAAQLAIVRGEYLGDVSQVCVAVAHDYHGISVGRLLLGTGLEQPRSITAFHIPSPIVEGPSRSGDPREERVVTTTRTIAVLEFDGAVLQYDFDDQQYRSWIRSPSVLVRGSRGELRDTRVRYLASFDRPVVSDLVRLETGGAGNHEGMFLRGYSFEGMSLSANEFAPARLADDEISLARILVAMHRYVEGGEAPYSIDQAAYDQQLATAIHRAARRDGA